MGPPAQLNDQWNDFTEDLNRIESKQMKSNIIFYPFTSETYTKAILGRNFHLYQQIW